MFGSMEHGRFATLTSGGNTSALTGQGLLTGLFISSGTPTITVYDGVDTTGTVIVPAFVAAAATPYPMPSVISKGIFIVMSGSGTGTCFYN